LKKFSLKNTGENSTQSLFSLEEKLANLFLLGAQNAQLINIAQE